MMLKAMESMTLEGGLRLASADLTNSQFASEGGSRLASSILEAVDTVGAAFLQTDLRSAEDFSTFIDFIGYRPFASYVGGTSIRSAPVARNVLNSTEIAQEIIIPLHQEMAYCRDIPDYIILFCSLAADGDQKTNLLGDMRRFTESLPDWAHRNYSGRNARLRRYLPTRGANVGILRMKRCWEDMFETDDRDLVAEIAKQRGWDIRWLENNALEVLQDPFPFFRNHPIYGETWCTQAFAYLPTIFEHNAELDGRSDDLRRLRAARHEAPEVLDFAVFDDGTPLDDDEALFLTKLLGSQVERLALQPGEMVILDNILTSHGRASFTGERKMYVSLGMRN